MFSAWGKKGGGKAAAAAAAAAHIKCVHSYSAHTDRFSVSANQTASERSTPTILEDQEAEDFEEAEYRQLQKEGYNFYRNLPSSHSGSMSTTATTQDLDQLLEELRRTSLDYTTSSTRSPATTYNGTHSSRLYSSQLRSAFAEPGASSTGR
ncbi:unnamed protein product [Hymenolepis diminuta]|uniref:Partitioning defective 3 homolog n=1 Tax=Hymenolepis diminuta TaxID=6216 RepID=A0A0R3SF72_HYMDI|nr:unnamed protein product [Hymenolepis diminuta]